MLSTSRQAEYAGKFVRAHARVLGSDLKDLWIEDLADCAAFKAYLTMLAAVPEDVKPKPPITLEQNTALTEFKNALHRPVESSPLLRGGSVPCSPGRRMNNSSWRWEPLWEEAPV